MKWKLVILGIVLTTILAGIIHFGDFDGDYSNSQALSPCVVVTGDKYVC